MFTVGESIQPVLPRRCGDLHTKCMVNHKSPWRADCLNSWNVAANDKWNYKAIFKKKRGVPWKSRKHLL